MFFTAYYIIYKSPSVLKKDKTITQFLDFENCI